jgi:hypothetical protein
VTIKLVDQLRARSRAKETDLSCIRLFARLLLIMSGCNLYYSPTGSRSFGLRPEQYAASAGWLRSSLLWSLWLSFFQVASRYSTRSTSSSTTVVPSSSLYVYVRWTALKNLFFFLSKRLLASYLPSLGIRPITQVCAIPGAAGDACLGVVNLAYLGERGERRLPSALRGTFYESMMWS